MATRWYLRPSGGTPGITPTPDAEWEFTTGFSRVVPALTKQNTAFANKTVTDPTGTNNRDALGYQFVYPIPTGTVFNTSQTFKGQMLAFEGALADNLRSQCIVRVIASNGTTIRAVLFDGDTSTLSGNPSSEWLNLSQRNVSITTAARAGSPVNLDTSYTTVAGDHIVIEVGYRKHNNANTTGTIRLGDTTGSTDLPENETQTTDGATWFEWSGNLNFPLQSSGAGTLTLGASAVGRIRKRSSASGTLTLGASATGQLQEDETLQSSASGTLTIGASAVGQVRLQSSGSSTLSLGASVAGYIRVQASASGSLTLSSQLIGHAKILASGAGTLSLDASLVGAVKLRSSAAGNLTLESSLAGYIRVQAEASGSLTIEGETSGQLRLRSSAAGALTLGALAFGSIQGQALHSVGTGLLTLSASVQAQVRARASGSASLSLSSTAFGYILHRPVVFGFFSLTGVAIGQIQGEEPVFLIPPLHLGQARRYSTQGISSKFLKTGVSPKYSQIGIAGRLKNSGVARNT